MKPFAFVFPGQGSQSVGMLDAWGEHPAVRSTLAEASDALGEDLGQLIRQGPQEALAMTANTQPVMLVAAIAAFRAWQTEGGALPAVVAGHSLGEYSALVAAGAIELREAVPLVRKRAQAMQEAVPAGVGAMAAVLGLSAERVVEGCHEVMRGFGPAATEVVEAVNFNDPAQTVIAGTQAAVAKACEVLKSMGAKRALPLAVSAPFHSTLMRPAAERLKEHLAQVTIVAPRIPVVNNVEACIQSDPASIRDALYEQAYRPVRWVDCIRQIKAQGVGIVIECGPGRVLAGLVRRIDAELGSACLHDPQSLTDVKGLLA